MKQLVIRNIAFGPSETRVNSQPSAWTDSVSESGRHCYRPRLQAGNEPALSPQHTLERSSNRSLCLAGWFYFDLLSGILFGAVPLHDRECGENSAAWILCATKGGKDGDLGGSVPCVILYLHVLRVRPCLPFIHLVMDSDIRAIVCTKNRINVEFYL